LISPTFRATNITAPPRIQEEHKKMPGTKSASLAGVKRKRDPSKAERRESKSKSRRKSPSESEDGEDIQSEILQLEAQILESRRHYNNIAILLQHAKRQEAEIEGSMLAAVALVRVFSRLLVTGDMVKSKGMGEAEATIVAWLKARYQELLDVLLDNFLRSEHPLKQSVALTLVMRLVKEEAKSQKDYKLKSGPLPRLIRVLLSLPQDDLNREEFAEKYFKLFDDVRYQTFQTIKCVYTYQI
jgi:U3 small nucleolar RNA-associated protein 19